MIAFSRVHFFTKAHSALNSIKPQIMCHIKHLNPKIQILIWICIKLLTYTVDTTHIRLFCIKIHALFPEKLY